MMQESQMSLDFKKWKIRVVPFYLLIRYDYESSMFKSEVLYNHLFKFANFDLHMIEIINVNVIIIKLL